MSVVVFSSLFLTITVFCLLLLYSCSSCDLLLHQTPFLIRIAISFTHYRVVLDCLVFKSNADSNIWKDSAIVVFRVRNALHDKFPFRFIPICYYSFLFLISKSQNDE